MPALNRIQLIALAQWIISLEGSEEEINEMVQRFAENIPDPEPLKYFSDSKYAGFTAEQIVDRCLDHKLIILGPP